MATGPEQTALQKSIFNAPPAAMPSKPANGVNAAEAVPTASAHGTKRPRDEEEEDDEDDDNEVEMEEDDDDDASMEEDDDD